MSSRARTWGIADQPPALCATRPVSPTAASMPAAAAERSGASSIGPSAGPALPATSRSPTNPPAATESAVNSSQRSAAVLPTPPTSPLPDVAGAAPIPKANVPSTTSPSSAVTCQWTRNWPAVCGAASGRTSWRPPACCSSGPVGSWWPAAVVTLIASAVTVTGSSKASTAWRTGPSPVYPAAGTVVSRVGCAAAGPAVVTRATSATTMTATARRPARHARGRLSRGRDTTCPTARPTLADDSCPGREGGQLTAAGRRHPSTPWSPRAGTRVYRCGQSPTTSGCRSQPS